MRPKPNVCHFVVDILKCIPFKEYFVIWFKLHWSLISWVSQLAVNYQQGNGLAPIFVKEWNIQKCFFYINMTYSRYVSISHLLKSCCWGNLLQPHVTLRSHVNSLLKGKAGYSGVSLRKLLLAVPAVRTCVVDNRWGAGGDNELYWPGMYGLTCCSLGDFNLIPDD